MRRTAIRAVVAAVVTALGAGLLTGCAGDGEGTGGDGRTTLTVGVFGAFGLEEAGLYDEYMRLHPEIRIEQTSIQRNENYYPQLLTRLSTDSGLADIQAVEVNNIAEITATQADRLVDLGGVAGVSEDSFLDWKWAQATTEDGRTVGLGTDIGPQAICYRKDLFRKAGLPTDRKTVGELWAGDWRKYLESGKRYRAGAPAGTSFVDSASGVLSAVVGSGRKRFYDENGEIVYKTNPAVKEAWDIAAEFATERLTGRLQQFTASWDQAMANGAFATVSCPAWMLGYIQDKAGPAGRDKWDVAAAPKPGNWGGSFLVVPEKGRNKAEAARLVAWLTAPEQQAKLFAERGSFPSAEAALPLPAVADAEHPYFGDAPIGRIFSEAARDIPVQIVGPKDLIIAQNLADIGMLQVDQKGRSPEEGWDAAVKAIDNALDL
jgi:cellobiose transport system substrate-binding protein